MNRSRSKSAHCEVDIEMIWSFCTNRVVKFYYYIVLHYLFMLSDKVSLKSIPENRKESGKKKKKYAKKLYDLKKTTTTIFKLLS